MVIEHNGDVYSCDHFVDRDHPLGNIMAVPLAKQWLTAGGRDSLAVNKGSTSEILPECPFFACRGECPKIRFVLTPEGEPGLNYLCDGYRMFFTHIDVPMKFTAQESDVGRAPGKIMTNPLRKFLHLILFYLFMTQKTLHLIIMEDTMVIIP